MARQHGCGQAWRGHAWTVGAMMLTLMASGCAGRFCKDACNPHGSTAIQQLASGGCRSCGQSPCNSPVAQHPLDHLRVALQSGGCGELYIGEWISDPPDCCDPCDQCGNYVGPRSCSGKKYPLWNIMKGRRNGGSYDGSCGACGMGLTGGPLCSQMSGCGGGGGCSSCGMSSCATGGRGMTSGVPCGNVGCGSCGTELFAPTCGAEPSCGCGSPVDYRMATPSCTSCGGGCDSGVCGSRNGCGQGLGSGYTAGGFTPAHLANPVGGGCSTCGQNVNWGAMYGN